MGNNVLVFDVETTGLPARRLCSYKDLEAFSNARVIELGYMVLSPNCEQIVRERSLLIRSVDRVDNSHIHGITTADIMERGVPVEEALRLFKDDLEEVDTIVAHNLEFDQKILQSEIFRAKGNDILIEDISRKNKLCTMLYGKEIMGVKKWPKLVELYKFLTGKRLEQTHRALDDVRACAECLCLMFSKP